MIKQLSIRGINRSKPACNINRFVKHKKQIIMLNIMELKTHTHTHTVGSPGCQFLNGEGSRNDGEIHMPSANKLFGPDRQQKMETC